MSAQNLTAQQAMAILAALSKSQQQIVTSVEYVPGSTPTVNVQTTTFGQLIKDMGFFNG